MNPTIWNLILDAHIRDIWEVRPLEGMISTQKAKKVGVFLHIFGAEDAEIIDLVSPKLPFRKVLANFRKKFSLNYNKKQKFGI